MSNDVNQRNPYITRALSVTDPFLATAPTRHPLRTPENWRCFFRCSPGDIIGTLATDGSDKTISKCTNNINTNPYSLYMGFCRFRETSNTKLAMHGILSIL